ncbi:hypothetical protein Bbelb_222630 [Branchiostoma belcheri]|nr:hypothetical protein Bbelb_222630 [Branchiostoma belcheri]
MTAPATLPHTLLRMLRSTCRRRCFHDDSDRTGNSPSRTTLPHTLRAQTRNGRLPKPDRGYVLLARSVCLCCWPVIEVSRQEFDRRDRLAGDPGDGRAGMLREVAPAPGRH